MMENWKVEKLGNIVSFISRGKSPTYVEHSEIAVLNQKAIRWGAIDNSALKYHDANVTIRKEFFIQKGDIVLNCTGDGTIGRAYYFRNEEQNLFADSHVTILRFNNEKVLPDFLIHLFPLPHYQTKIYNLVTGSTNQLELTKGELVNLLIDVPPLSIQQKIADILGKYDALIENCEQQISTLETTAKEIYREWFVRGRCPYAVYTEGHKLPNGWKQSILREAVDFYIGGGWGEEEANAEFVTGGFVIRGTDIPNLKKGKINRSVYRYHKSSNIESRELQEGDIVFEVSGGSKDQSLGRNVLITKEILNLYGDKVIAASFCKSIRYKQACMSPYFLQLLFDRLIETEEMGQFEVQSTGISNFQFEDFLNFQPFILPTKECLNSFDEIVSPIFKKIGLLGATIEQLRKTRDTLLPRLMSGQLRVHTVEN